MTPSNTTKQNVVLLKALFIAVGLVALLCPLQGALADPGLLRRSIVEYNLASYQKGLSDGSYRGAEGILHVTPEVGRSLGLTVVMTEEYRQARALDAEGERLFSQAVAALTSGDPEEMPGEHARRAGEWALASREASASARRLFGAYRSQVTPQADERLNPESCSRIMDRLLEESLKKASFNLRDGLGIFYNRCGGLDGDTPPLTPENIRFVNRVFSEFTEKGSGGDQGAFDLGRQDPALGRRPGSSWKSAAGREGVRIAALLESCLDKEGKAGYPVDPLLFMALMRRESNFDPRAVSYVGAAGLTQIMPKTGQGLGMERIYLPSYFDEAMSLLKQERTLRNRAISLISDMTQSGMPERAVLARKYMQESIDCGRKRSRLFAQYRRELLGNNRDDRLDPCQSVAFGYQYFSDLMKMQQGDISLALAAYNAGPHRVKEYGGLPPFSETVTFRNTVLKYYREYLERLSGAN